MNRSIKVLYSGQPQLGSFYRQARAIDFEQGLPKLRTNTPIRLQGIHVGAGYAAF